MKPRAIDQGGLNGPGGKTRLIAASGLPGGELRRLLREARRRPVYPSTVSRIPRHD